MSVGGGGAADLTIDYAPNEISMRFCPKCGRDDRVRPFVGRGHWMNGAKCTGRPMVIYYTRNDLVREVVER